MDSKKQQLLEKAYDEYIKLMMYDFPLDKISEIVANDVTGYGTTLDEKVLEIERLRKIIADQREQGAGLDMQISTMPVHRRISPDEDTAIYTDEIEISMVVDGTRNGFPLRLSSVFEFNDNTWKLVHLHGSKAVETEGDTWHLNEWKQKNEQLQKLVDEKTAELVKQNRELEIEATLERVRARTMAMQKSKELAQVATLMFQQMEHLGIETYSSGFNILDENHKTLVSWMSNPSGAINPPFFMPLNEYEQHGRFYKAWKNQVPLLEDDITGERMAKHYQYLRSFPLLDAAFDKSEKAGIKTPDRQVHNAVFFTYGYLLFITLEPSPQFHDIFKRFAKVFEQTYTRFLDLQKAEAQTKEAQIETALEKVRSRSLAMKQSDELQEVISVVFMQMQDLGIYADASLINILSDESKDFYLWIGTGGQTYAQKIRIPYIEHPVFDVFYEAHERGETFMTNALTRAEKDSFFEYAFKYSDLKLMPADRQKYVMDSAGFARSFAWSKNSGITIQNYAGIPYSDQENEILKRFAQVFEQAYTRFLDVKNAEAQAREAIKQASLDRVRGEIASMRNKDDLNRITPLIWKELTTLGISFIRCGVLIMDKSRKMIQTYLSTPEGKSLTAFELKFADKGIGSKASKHWLENEIYTDYWDKNQFISFMQNLIKEGKIDNPKSFQGTYDPPEELYLNFVPFKQGMLYVGNIYPLASNELDLVHSLAKTFAIAFARYVDFKQLEAAKNEIELTLSELKSTQAQLIQSEKMASLGELTAGIAHEIQNPLNFVNNFSEVNKEMLEEMNEEIEKGNLEEVKAIAKDVIENEQKINHHGKRADAIVKGMLQHSRTSTGQKELTDINKLADEYLRLSYHGLRAKDKSFNADFKTEFDESLPKINVIPQDIGRVLLNLINNAFYAAPLPSKGGFKDPNYIHKPLVIVKTSYLPPSGASPDLSGGPRGAGTGGACLVSISDNGPGIPAAIIDKIFQPFFTTKPTGSGTGLGLSLSYDIIKTHGGEIKVDSESGIGTTFSVMLKLKD